MKQEEFVINRIGYSDLVEYLRSVDKDFKHPISSKTEIEIYARKLNNLGECYTISKGLGIPIALIGFYVNDYQDRIAYLSILSVKKEYQSKGYAQKLVNQMILKCRELQFHQIKVYTENSIAEKLYKRNGFQCMEDGSLVLNLYE